MYILANVDFERNQVTVFDTTDATYDAVPFNSIVEKCLAGEFKIHGIIPLNKRQKSDSVPLNCGVSISELEARQAFAKYYMDGGCSRAEAYIRAGIGNRL